MKVWCIDSQELRIDVLDSALLFHPIASDEQRGLINDIEQDAAQPGGENHRENPPGAIVYDSCHQKRDKKMLMITSNIKRSESGEGLMEYAFILVLIAAVGIVGMAALGPVVRSMYCEMLSIMGSPCEVEAEAVAEGTIEATKVHYNRGLEEAHIDATYDGGYNPDVTLTTSPGGVMVQEGDHYDIKFPLSGCPCTITIMSSEGESTTVVVDP